MEKNMENEMETGGIYGFKELKLSYYMCLHLLHEWSVILALQRHTLHRKLIYRPPNLSGLLLRNLN